CPYCYARKLANGRLKQRYLANDNVAIKLKLSPPAESLKSALVVREALEDPFYPRFWSERLKELQPIGGLVCEMVYPPKTPKGIFVCDMSDLFGIGIPEQWTQAVLSMIKKWPAHRFYLLTKQPQNLIKFSPFPENCWVGVTVTNHKAQCEALNYLREVKAKVKYLSLEPLLNRLDANLFLTDLTTRNINWVIIGAQTKPTVYPKIEDVEEIVRACDKAGVKVFLKDNLRPLLEDDGLNPLYCA
ncbi:unnamed protein product, partial [marine sediment metagenome]